MMMNCCHLVFHGLLCIVILFLTMFLLFTTEALILNLKGNMATLVTGWQERPSLKNIYILMTVVPVSVDITAVGTQSVAKKNIHS